jgi:hypothetical protein
MLATLAACAPVPGRALTLPAPAHSMTFRIVSHLAFGVRVESVSVLLDGALAFEAHDVATAGGESDRASVQPGVHTISVTLRASEPCGLLEQPRASVAVHATTAFSVGERPAAVYADLYAREATRDPIQDLAVRFTGDQVVLGVSDEAQRTPGGCDAEDALCALDAKAARARSQRDVVSASCYETRRAEVRDLGDLLEDSYAAVSREGVTTGDAENAQLRARYARARLRSLTVEAEACAAGANRHSSAGVVEREVERTCPALDVTAGLGRF